MPDFPESSARIVTVGDADFHEWNINDIGTPTPGVPADIDPVSNGEPANQTIFRRPPENLRQRDEFVKTFLRDVVINSDMDRLIALNITSGEFLWKGPQNPLDPTDPDLGMIFLDTPGSFLEIRHANWPDSKIQIPYAEFQTYYDTTKSGASPIFLHSFNLREGDTLYCTIPRTFNETSGRVSPTYPVVGADIYKMPLSRGLYKSGIISGSGIVPGDTIHIYNNLGGDPLRMNGWTANDYYIPISEVPTDFPDTLIVNHEDAFPVRAGMRFSVGNIGPNYVNKIPLTPDGWSVPDYRFRDYKLSSLLGIVNPEDMPIIIPIATIHGGRAILLNGAELKTDQSYPEDWPVDITGIETIIFDKLADETQPPDPDLEPEGTSYIGCDLVDDPGVEWQDVSLLHNSSNLSVGLDKVSKAFTDRNFPGCKGLLSGFETLTYAANIFTFENDADPDVVFWVDGNVVRFTDGDNPLDIDVPTISAPNEWRWIAWEPNSMTFVHRETNRLERYDIPLVYYHLDGGDNVDNWYDVRLWVGRGEQVLNKTGFNINLIPGVFSVGGDPSFDFLDHNNFGNFRNFGNAMDYFYVLDLLMTGPGNSYYFSTLNILSDITITQLKDGGTDPWKVPSGLRIVGIGSRPTIRHQDVSGPLIELSSHSGRYFTCENVGFSQEANIPVIRIDLSVSDIEPINFTNCSFVSDGTPTTNMIDLIGTNDILQLNFINCYFYDIPFFMHGVFPSTSSDTSFMNCYFDKVDNLLDYIVNGRHHLINCKFVDCAENTPTSCFIGNTSTDEIGGTALLIGCRGNVQRLYHGTSRIEIVDCPSIKGKNWDFITASTVAIINSTLENESAAGMQPEPFITINGNTSIISRSTLFSQYNERLILCSGASEVHISHSKLLYAYEGIVSLNILEYDYHINDCYFTKYVTTPIGQAQKAAIYLEKVENVFINNNFFTTIVDDTTADRSVAMLLDINNFVISGNMIVDQPGGSAQYLGIGINMYSSCTKGSIIDNFIYTDYEPIFNPADQIKALNIENNKLISNDPTSYKIDINNITASIINNNNFTPLSASMNGGGLRVDVCSYTIIEDNYIASADLEAFTFTSILSDCIISKNMIALTQSYALYMVTGQFSLISGNYINGTSIVPSMRFENCASNIITDNHIKQSTANAAAIGIQIDSTGTASNTSITNNHISAYSGISSITNGTDAFLIHGNLIDATRGIEIKVGGLNNIRHVNIKNNFFNIRNNTPNDELAISLNEGGVTTSTWENITIQGNSIRANTFDAIYCYGLDEIHIRENQVYNCNNGIIISSCNGGSICGNIINTAAVDGITILGPFAATKTWQINNNYLDNCTVNNIYIISALGTATIDIMGNVIKNMGTGTGIHAQGCAMNNIVGNVLFTENAATTRGIHVLSSGQSSITGNALHTESGGIYDYGIKVAGVMSSIIGNSVGDCGETCIQLDAATSGVIIGNNCLGCKTAGSDTIRLLGTRNMAIGNYIRTQAGQGYGLYLSDPTGASLDQIGAHNFIYWYNTTSGAHNIANNPKADNLVTLIDGQDTPNWSFAY